VHLTTVTRCCGAVVVVLVASCGGGGTGERTGPEAARFEIRAVERTGRTYARPGPGELNVRWQGQWLLLGPELVNGYDVKSIGVLGVDHRDEYTIQVSVVGTAVCEPLCGSIPMMNTTVLRSEVGRRGGHS
jgi:hypothetical protein